MLTTEAVKNWLKEQLPLGTGIFVGHIDGNCERFVGVYEKTTPGKQRICLGGSAMTHDFEKRVSILIHWTKDPVETESFALTIWGRMYAKTRLTMGETKVISIDPGAGPINVGYDHKGVAEFVIEATILYERTERECQQ
jgi:hypothetical protein